MKLGKSLSVEQGFEPLERESRQGIGTIYADDNGYGDVRLGELFQSEDPAYRADVLKDVITLLQEEYEKAIYELMHRKSVETKPVQKDRGYIIAIQNAIAEAALIKAECSDTKH